MGVDTISFDFLKCRVNNYITLNDQEIVDIEKYFEVRSFSKNQVLLNEGNTMSLLLVTQCRLFFHPSILKLPMLFPARCKKHSSKMSQ